MQQSLSVIEAIQLILAPAVMISACGLLMLGINTKFSNVLNRIRALNEEKRRLISSASDRTLAFPENQRLASVARQLQQLLRRAYFVRNSLLCYIAAVALFVITSLLIGVHYFSGMAGLQVAVILMFLVGMISVVMGIVYAALDTKMGYDVVRFEVEVDE